jgi:hypothetical protein
MDKGFEFSSEGSFILGKGFPTEKVCATAVEERNKFPAMIYQIKPITLENSFKILRSGNPDVDRVPYKAKRD